MHFYQILINQLYTIDAYVHHTTFSLWCNFRQRPWNIGSASAERAGEGEVGGCTQRVQTAWLSLGSALEHWVGHCCPPLHKWA